MKQPARLIVNTCLAAVMTGAGSGLTSAAEVSAAQQDLANVKRSNPVLSATWKRQQDSYTLQIVFDQSKLPARASTSVSMDRNATVPVNTLNDEEMRQRDIADVTEALKAMVPPNVAGPGTQERSSFFIGNTIANLRGLNPTFCGRTLTLVDGRRVPAGQEPKSNVQPSAVPVVATPLASRDRRVEVWLLNSNGTQFHPDRYFCDLGSRISTERTDVSVSYEYFLPENAQPVAASIRIGDEFYIEKLQPLASPPTVQ
jgi:hypothetical protein